MGTSMDVKFAHTYDKTILELSHNLMLCFQRHKKCKIKTYSKLYNWDSVQSLSGDSMCPPRFTTLSLVTIKIPKLHCTFPVISNCKTIWK